MFVDCFCSAFFFPLLLSLSVSSCDHKHFCSFFRSLSSFFFFLKLQRFFEDMTTLTVPFFPPGTCLCVQGSCVHLLRLVSALHSASILSCFLAFFSQAAQPLCSHLLYCLHPLVFFTLMELSPSLCSADRVCFAFVATPDSKLLIHGSPSFPSFPPPLLSPRLLSDSSYITPSLLCQRVAADLLTVRARGVPSGELCAFPRASGKSLTDERFPARR